MDYALILTKKYPNSEWFLDGDSYDGLNWLSDGEKPSKAELEAHWPIVTKELQDEAKAKQLAKDNAISKLSVLGLEIDDLKALGLG